MSTEDKEEKNTLVQSQAGFQSIEKDSIDNENNSMWISADILGLHKWTNTCTVKTYYILLLIGVACSVIGLIVFMLPIDSSAGSKASKLSRSISYWEFTKLSTEYLSSTFLLRWSSTTFDIKDFNHQLIDKSTKKYKYRVDKYEPTYLDTFHVYDHKDNRFSSQKQPIDDKFVFVDENIPVPKKYTDYSCLWYNYQKKENKNKGSVIRFQPECDGIGGFEAYPVKSTAKNISEDCSKLGEEICKNLCEKDTGFYKKIGDVYNCYYIEILAQICIRVIQNEGDFQYYTGCFYDGSPFFYEKLNYGETYALRDIVSMVRMTNDPYAEAYRQSNNKYNYYDLLTDSLVTSIIKWIFFAAAMIFIGQYFGYIIQYLADENEIMRHKLRRGQML